MDTYLMENRYAYCNGDLIKFFDPTGHTPEHWVSWALSPGRRRSRVLPHMRGATPVIGALGLSTLTTSVIATGLSGAAGNVAAGYIQALAEGLHYERREVLVDALTGELAPLP